MAFQRKSKSTHPFQRSGLTVLTPQERDFQPEILLEWQSALKCGLGGVEPGSSHTGELPSLVLPWPTSVLDSGDQSVVKAMIQQFPYTYEKSKPSLFSIFFPLVFPKVKNH